jgi:hypothetical protein
MTILVIAIISLLCLPVVACAWYFTTLICRFARWRRWALRWYLGLIGPIFAGVATVAFVCLGFSLQHGGWGKADFYPLFFWVSIIGSASGIIPSEIVVWHYWRKF